MAQFLSSLTEVRPPLVLNIVCHFGVNIVLIRIGHFYSKNESNNFQLHLTILMEHNCVILRLNSYTIRTLITQNKM